MPANDREASERGGRMAMGGQEVELDIGPSRWRWGESGEGRAAAQTVEAVQAPGKGVRGLLGPAQPCWHTSFPGSHLCELLLLFCFAALNFCIYF